MDGEMRLIILAAGQGKRLRPLTNDRPKCLVDLGGRPLLQWQIDAANVAGIDDIVVIGGYRVDQIKKFGVSVLENPRYASTNMVQTLFCAGELFADGFVMAYGDIVYSPSILSRLLEDKRPVSVVVDRDWRSYWARRFEDPLSDAETLRIGANGNLLEIGQKPQTYDDIQAQYIGLVAFRAEGVKSLQRAFRSAESAERTGRTPFGGKRNLDALHMTDLLQGMIQSGVALYASQVSGSWIEVDSLSDLALAEVLLTEGRLGAGYGS